MKISSPQEEGHFFASKWIEFSVLASVEELAGLFSHLEKASIFLLGAPLAKEKVEISTDYFLEVYGQILEDLKRGELKKETCRKILPVVLTLSSDAVYLQALPGDKYLLKLTAPVIQMQAHFFRYSPVDGSLRSMVMGEDCLFWGIQFSYPQMFQDPKTEEIRKSSGYPNEKLFLTLRKWVRDATLATPFLLPDGKKVNSPIRLGKGCFSWISQHPELARQGLKVVHAC